MREQRFDVNPRPKLRPSTWRTAGALLAVAGAVLVAAFLGRAVVAPRVVTTPSGVRVGRLPDGERASDLNLLLITLDTTRADRMGAYGSAPSATPTFDRVARDGVLFERAETAAPLTLPAHTTLFTAKYPPGHAVRDNGGFFLDERETTLAERLKAGGFKTGGFVGAFVLDRRWGIAQGFDTYFDNFDPGKAKGAPLASIERRGNEVADHALEWLQTAARSRFFAWIHFYDAHSPYDPPEPYRTRFAADPYLGEIAFVDAQAKRIIDFLEQRDLLRKTIVVFIGDHGESLGEHGESTHGFFVYESVLHVPFALLAPFDAIRGRRVADVVRSVDVVPTLLDLLGIPLNDKVEGTSLTPLMTGAARELALDAYAEAMYPRYHFGWSDLRSLTSGRYKYIAAPHPELYDIEQDPSESHNLYEARRTLGDRMAATLSAIEDPFAAAANMRPVDVDPDARARLAALGYVGTFVSAPTGPRSALADPKDKIELFNLITHAREELQDKQDSNAGLDMLERVVAKDPQVVDAWLLMGNEYADRRRFDLALESFRRALALKPDYDLAVINTARIYRDLGRPDDAVVGLQQLLKANPNNVQARQQLAQALLEAGHLMDAERELNAVLKQDPNMAAARGSLGALRLKQGDVATAEREIRAALTQEPDLTLAHFNLALVAEQSGNTTTAVTEYQQEIARNPHSYMAQFNLGKLYEKIGNRPGQLLAYQDAVASNPQFAEGYFFLAKLYFDLHQLDDAIRCSKRGLEIQPRGEWSPLGHFVLADAYAAQGRPADAAREVAVGRRIAAQHRRETR